MISEKPVNNMPLGNLSGISYCHHQWLGISDKDDKYIYQLVEKSSYYEARKISLPPIPKLNDLGSSFTAEQPEVFEGQGNLDFEAIVCDKEGSLYLVSESTNQILKVSNGFSQANWLILPNNLIYEAKKANLLRHFNAKFEGLAVDGEITKLWLVAERDSRGIILLEKVNDQWVCEDCVLLSEHLMRSSPKLLGSKRLPLDFSDAFYYQGKLFTLERLQHQICRRNSHNAQLEKCWQFEDSVLSDEKFRYGAYSFGQAEALWLNDDEVWIGIDNNNMYRNDGEYRPIIYRFKAPNSGWLD
ncbi:MAG: DNA topoisomerase IV [Neisseriaceae bacterium]|nr:MAG: DNA topoisomerase IV [Neisseriaceae bacterium]